MWLRKAERFESAAFILFSILTVGSLLAAIFFAQPLLILLPVIAMIGWYTLNDFRTVFFLTLALLPLSIELEIGGSTTDMPVEPATIGLMFVFIIFSLTSKEKLPRAFYQHPLILLLLAHMLWIGAAVFYSSNVLVSLKFFLAKTWYVLVFTFLATLLIRNLKDFKRAFFFLLIPTLLTVVIILIRHARMHFEFDEVNAAVMPIYRNHVNYSALLALLLPFAVAGRFWFPKNSRKRFWMNVSILLLLTGIFFAYTRTQWLAVFLMPFYFFILKNRLTKWILAGSGVLVLFFVIWLSRQNHFLKFAPDFEHTIYHERLGEHLEATYQLEDVSSAERLYRWVAGARMFEKKPVCGYGPGNFYEFYRPYTVDEFETYVSDNEEKSTVHNTFLQVLIEQGIIGFMIFISFITAILIAGERIYHQTKQKEEKMFLLAVMMSMMVMLINLFLGDMMEASKVGPVFFLLIALLVGHDLRNRNLVPKSADDQVRAE